MKKIFTLLFFITLSFLSCNVKKEKTKKEKERKYYVINVSGAKVYKKPTFHSKTISKIKIGESFIGEKTIKTNERMFIGKKFSLQGNWIKLKGIKGFVFSSDVTNKEVKFMKKYLYVWINLVGELEKIKEEKKNNRKKGENYPEYIEYEYYKNATLKTISSNGCTEYIWKYKNFNINEIYHITRNNNNTISSDSIIYSNFKEKIGNKIYFEELDAIQDLTIELKKDSTIITSLYSCD